MKTIVSSKIAGLFVIAFFALSPFLLAQKPLLENEANGVKISVFKSDQQGQPTPNNVWIGALNSNKEAMIVTAVVFFHHKSLLDGKEVTLTKSCKVAQVVSAGKAQVLWKSGGDAIEVTEIKELQVK